MARKITTAKQSSGAGFLFEDKVFSWFAITLLTQDFPFSNISANVCEIAFQARSKGWLFDDLVLTMKTSSENTFNIPITVKSNVQFSGNGPNTELLTDLWEQYLNEESTVFDKQNDYLCIVNSPLGSVLSADLNRLLKAARSSTYEILESNISQGEKGSFSKRQIKLLKGFKCPSELALKHNIDDKDIWKLLSRVILLEFDFENAPSKDESKLIQNCKNCLSNADNSQADLLKIKLCEIRSELSANEGSFINYQTLVDDIRLLFNLKGLPQHEADWKKIASITSQKCNSIQDKIGGEVKLERGQELSAFKQMIRESSFVFLLGKSGYGKSVLLKHFFQELDLSNKIKTIWLDSDIIYSNNLEDFFDLSNSFVEIIKQSQDQEGYIIIDSVERFCKEEHLKLLFSFLNYIKQNQTPWKVIFSCQSNDYEDIIKGLYRINLCLSHKVFDLQTIENEKLIIVQQKFPALANLFKHNHLNDILKNLKYLDLLAFNLSKDTNVEINDFFGESNIIDLIWNEEVENVKYDNAEQRSRFLQLLSENQAEKMTFSTSQSDFNIWELSPVTSLKKSKLLRVVNDRLAFEHDLFSDWARYKLIKDKSDTFKEYVVSKNILSPLWGRSIRLYGVYLLEKEVSVDSWIETFSDLNENIPNEKIIQDLLLDSIIYSNSTFRFLELLYFFFIENEGQILKRFVDRFLLKATKPNPQILKLAEEMGGITKSEASIYHRIPNYSYWFPVVEFLRKYIDSFIPLLGDKVAELGKVWLLNTPEDFHLREEIAFCVFKNTEWVFNMKLNNGWIKDDIDEKVYKSMLLGVYDMPKENIDICLKLCKRKKFQNQERKLLKSDFSRHERILEKVEIRKPIQWEDGPYEMVDETFSEVFLSTEFSYGLISLYPDKAKEIILALLIDPPCAISFNYDFHYKYDINEPHDWHPPYYGRGPFLDFLNVNSNIGIDTIISLVNFATSQWAKVEEFNKRQVPTLKMEFEERKLSFIGDYRIYFWYRAAGGAPHAISSALMALEKFLINSIDKGENIEPFIKQILKNANSVCFIGLLCFIGKYHSSLFLGILQPVLSIFDLYRWETSLMNTEGHQMLGLTDLDENIMNEIREWNNLECRRIPIYFTGHQLFKQTYQSNNFYKKIIELWNKELYKDEEKDGTDLLKMNFIAQFDLENYEVLENNGETIFEYNEPKKLNEKLTPLRIESEKPIIEMHSIEYLREINTGGKYSKDELNEVWEKVFLESKISLTPEKYHKFANEISSLFEVLKLLFEHQNLWIDKYDNHVNWTIDFLEKVLIKAPYRQDDYYEVGLSSAWSDSIARFLPKLWSKNLKNKKIRRSLGLLFLKSANKTNKILFSNIAKELRWNQQDFIQLQNLAIKWSSGIYDFNNTDNYEKLPSVYEETKYQKLIKRIFNRDKDITWIVLYGDKILKEFINDKTEKVIINLLDKKSSTNSASRKNYEARKYREKRGFDTQLLQNVFSPTPEFSDVKDISEYKYLLLLWDQLVGQIINENEDIISYSEVNSEYPNEFSSWVLKRISRHILRLKKEDNPSRYWKPILSYGYLCPKQSHFFLENYFLNDFNEEKNKIKFHEEWEQMILFCSQSENWKSKGVKTWNNRDIEQSLYGVSYDQIDIWDDDHKDLLKLSSKNIIKWFFNNVHNYDRVRMLILLLRKKSGGVLLKEGLTVLYCFVKWYTQILSIPAPDGKVHRQFEYNESFARTASYLWEEYRDVIKKDKELYNNYKVIVMYLVSINEPIGLELQNRILD
ncbi:hypothetical protein [Aureibacter tunicatorum]|uniref:ATP-binding protein n=1 Tax=Aureibacter tunicatorum TaxID=866807 RepID=A0AAE4BR83_9BACT|nr:hypothetical protein [Aureibacter tunicatorum]MDR6239949.1 hypothetical protein [Aureibacter tunicatorum]BDD04423.1 hypothetical protein AUTU_19060 [Aureibacter tunicatorum]